MSRLREARRDEEGFTLVELIVSSAILMLAMAGFMAALSSLQSTSRYESGRVKALTDMRITAGTFAKDVRHAARIVVNEPSRIQMDTWAGGSLKRVTYEVVTTGGETNLERTQAGSSSRLFIVKLTSDSIFEYDNTVPADIRRVVLRMVTRPTREHPTLRLDTEVALRNVTLL